MHVQPDREFSTSGKIPDLGAQLERQLRKEMEFVKFGDLVKELCIGVGNAPFRQQRKEMASVKLGGMIKQSDMGVHEVAVRRRRVEM